MHLHSLIYGGLPVLLALFCNPVFCVQENEIDTVIDRGLEWIMTHPATCQDGGFLDIVDEALFYRTLRRLSTTAVLEKRYQQASADCLSRLASSPEFEQRQKKQDKTLFQHYHLLLATHLIEVGRERSAGRDTVIAEAQRALMNSRFENPTFRLTIAQLLLHLGAEPSVNMKELMDASLISRITQPVGSRFATDPFGRPALQGRLEYYALIHEVAALTDFGHLQASPWLLERRILIGRILQQGARRTMASGDADLLAELLLCNHMLDLPLNGDLRSGIAFLVTSQQADGSWGKQETRRPNRSRHAVQTATAALLAYRPALELK